jgi:hypothetical protein
MAHLFRLLLLLCCLLPPVARALEQASPHAALRVGPAPAWIAAPLDPLQPVLPEDEPTTQLDYLVSERQELTRDRAAYTHFAYRVADASGLAAGADFSLTFDPAYETVVLHHLRLVRGGKIEDRLNLADFEVIRQERDRDRYLYDGRLTAIHQLRDVRVGDIIDYAYTVTGANPVFGDHHVTTLSLGWGRPVRQFRCRLLQPEGRPLYHRLRGENAFAPVRGPVADGLAELRWERSPLPAIVPESAYPEWHVAYPLVQLGEFATWAEVVAWALPLYAPGEDTPALRAKIAELRAAAPDPAGRVLAALVFVQEEIRYLGIELGANSHRPTAPGETLERRFGDCKDKTLLLCTLLRGLDLEADPALVHSSFGRVLPGSLPTPLAFDHVIARVRLPGGDVFWLDSTRLRQAGNLAQRTAPDFGHALVVRADQADLVPMSRPVPAEGTLQEEISFTSHAFDGPVDLDILSTFTGERATAMRGYLSDTTIANLTRDYLNYYLQKFPGATSRGPVSWHDDRAANLIQLRELYSVPDFWTAKTPGLWRCELYPHAISELVRPPASQRRVAPLALPHPRDTRIDIRLLLHTDVQVGPLDLEIDDERLRYVSSVRQDGREIQLTYRLRTKQDHVPVGDVPAHTEALAKIRADLLYSLSKDTNPPAPSDAPTPDGFRVNPWAALVVLFSLAGSGYAAWRVLFRRRLKGIPPPLPGHDTPRLGGWLILFGLGVLVRCFTPWLTLGPHASTFFSLATWEALTTAASPALNRPLAALILVELAGNVCLVVLVLLAAVLFFLRRREAPRWNVAVFLYCCAILVLDLVAGYFVAGTTPAAADWKNLFQTFLPTFIWVPYLLVSERVKATFVR